MRIVRFLRTILEFRHFPIVLAVIAFAISIPALKTGWLPLDDLRHRVKLLDPSELDPRLYETGLVPENSGRLSTVLSELHTVVRSGEDIEKLKNYGTFPWWTNDNIRYSNWRPIDAFTHWLDYCFFPNNPVMIHAHNLFWFAAVIFLIAVLYRKLIGPVWVAGLAAVLYLLDDSNYIPAMWIANRSLLISLVFTALTIIAYHRRHTTGSISAVVTAVFCFLCSLLSTEAGIATFAYLFAYAVTLYRASWARRAFSLLPYVLVIVGWRIVYNALGHGAFASGWTVDPVREPIRYLFTLLEHFPILLFGQWAGPPAEFYSFSSDSFKIWFWLVAAGFLALLLIVILPLIRRDRLARFWFIGMVFSILPIAATIPMNRNLLFVAIGAFGLTAQFVAGLFTKSFLTKFRWQQIAAWAFCVLLLLVHIVFAGIARAAAPKAVSFVLYNVTLTIEVGQPDKLEEKVLVAVNAPNPMGLAALPLDRFHRGQSLPRAIRSLVPGFTDIEIIRTGPNSLLLKAICGNFLSAQQSIALHPVYFYKTLNDLCRTKSSRFHQGQRIELPGMVVEVIAVDADGLPTEVAFEFDVPLDKASLYWLQWDWRKSRFIPFNIPEIGQIRKIPGPSQFRFKQACI